MQSIPGNPLAAGIMEVIGQLWPALQDLLLKTDAEVLHFDISRICHDVIQAECPPTVLTGFGPLLPSFFRTSVKVGSS